MSWHRPAGALRSDEADVVVTPQTADWEFSGLRVFTLGDGRDAALDLGPDEAVIVPLSARDVSVTVDGESYRLAGRSGVFASVSDWVFAPKGARVTLSGGGGEVAVCTARARTATAAAYVAAADVPVEVRGAGRSTRQITNIATPGSFAGADRINVCEVITPGGNWSSWPPHRHDGIGDCPTANEEIYYFRIGTAGTTRYSTDGFGLHRTYTPPNPDGTVDIDEHVTVRDGDVFCIPRGYHGPCVAAPGYTMYYLNVLAGPGGERSMAFCDDPTHHWAVSYTHLTLPTSDLV